MTANYSDSTLSVLLNFPRLTLHYSNNAADLSWSTLWPGYELQQNSNLATTNNWINVSNPTGTNHVVITPATGTKFFRLRHP